ncbi:MAG: phytoene desaturase family protein [Terriglobia bacterium]
MKSSYDAIVIGSGPNGLAAAITLARAGHRVLVVEAQRNLGGGARSEPLTLPGFTHDVCSAVHPLALASPFFAALPLGEHGLEWIHAPLPLAHALDDDSVPVRRSIDGTAEGLGEDRDRYRTLANTLANDWGKLAGMFLRPPRIPRHPLAAFRFGRYAIRSACGFVRSAFKGDRAQALFAGLAAHSMLPLEKPPSAAFGLILMATAHVMGWPFPRGGSQNITRALASYLRSLGGEIVVNSPVESLDDLPSRRVVLCDLTPRQLLHVAGRRLPEDIRRGLARFRYGPGAYKVDWALSAPIPWKSPPCAQAGTVHLGGAFDEIAASERDAWQGEHAEKPFVLLAQPSLFDETRAPQGKHTAWAYCHVPQGSPFEMLDRIEAQVERFAPGFRSRILAKHVLPPSELERHNANLIGGSINGGVQDLRQLFWRPTRRLYSAGKGLYLCSSSTPPGPGVHGLCGFYAAQAAIRDVFR